MDFGTFVAVWANLLTLLALYLLGSAWLLKNIPERYKREVCNRLGESRADYDKNVNVKHWSILRYACYALIAQCMHIAVMWQS